MFACFNAHRFSSILVWKFISAFRITPAFWSTNKCELWYFSNGDSPSTDFQRDRSPSSKCGLYRLSIWYLVKCHLVGTNSKTRLGHEQRKRQFAFCMEACAFTPLQMSSKEFIPFHDWIFPGSWSLEPSSIIYSADWVLFRPIKWP